MTNTNEGNLAQFIHFFPTKSCGEVLGFVLELTSKRIVLMSFPLSLFPVRASNITPSVQLTFPESGFRVPQLSGGASVTYWRPAFYVSLSLQQFMNSKHSGFYKDRYGIVSIAFE